MHCIVVSLIFILIIAFYLSIISFYTEFERKSEESRKFYYWIHLFFEIAFYQNNSCYHKRVESSIKKCLELRYKMYVSIYLWFYAWLPLNN